MYRALIDDRGPDNAAFRPGNAVACHLYQKP